MIKNKKDFTRIRLVVLSIMGSITIFLLAIDSFLLYQKFQQKINTPSPALMTSIVESSETPTVPSTTYTQTTQPTATRQGTTALLRTLTPTINPGDQTPSSSPVTTSTATAIHPPQFFTNEWEEKTINWRWFSTMGNDNLWDVYNEAGVLVFTMSGKDTNGYFIYEPWDYKNVKVSTQMEVRSLTKSASVIICNYSKQTGWYEFVIGTNGLWELRAHDTSGKTGYISLSSGGSLAIQTGEGINEYTAICEGNHLTFFINGTQVIDYTDKVMNYQRGKIGIGVFSYSEVPVLIESAWVKVSQP